MTLNIFPHSIRRRLPFVSLVTVLSVTMFACGSGDGELKFEQINPGIKTYSIADFQSAGFKVVKEYDVEGLTGATSAVFGFQRYDGADPQSYELRFYKSHEDAVQLGTSFAEEVTGENAVLVVSKMRWSKAEKEERETNPELGGTAPTYWNYAIHSNVVMLCEGNWLEQSLEVCADLVKTLDVEF